jgi:hypothetical protein
MPFRDNKDDEARKPWLLEAIERIVAPPDQIRATVAKVRSRTRRRWPGSPVGRDFMRAVADDLIEHHAKKTALAGVATSAINAVPGFGNFVAVLGTSAADLVISLKVQVELVTALAHLFGRDIDKKEEIQLYLTMAGLGMATHASAVAAEEFSLPALRLILRRLLKRRGKRLIWKLFRLLTRVLLGRGLRRLLPVALRATLSYAGNREVTRQIGRRARDLFLAEFDEEQPEIIEEAVRADDGPERIPIELQPEITAEPGSAPELDATEMAPDADETDL